MKSVNNQSFKTEPTISLSEVESLFINSKTDIPLEIPIVTIKDKMFNKQGGIGVVMGKPKSGKSTILELIITLSLSNASTSRYDNLGFNVEPANEKNIVIFDTEQSQGDIKDAVLRVRKRLNLNEDDTRLKYAYLRQNDIEYRRKYILATLQQIPNIHLVVIDGFADLVTDHITDAKDCKAFVSEILSYTDKFNTSIIGAIHENNDNGKGIGHLGSLLEQKANGVIRIVKKGRYHYVEPRHIRKAGDFDKIYFQKDSEGFPFEISEEQARALDSTIESNKSKKLQQLEKYCNEIFATDAIGGKIEEMPRKDFYSRLKDVVLKYEKERYKNPSEQRFKTYISTLQKEMFDSIITTSAEKENYIRYNRI